MNIRIGQGIDFHRLGEGLPLWMGGVQIPFHKGFIAHSDGDVLLHAICDALLGAASLGDIGTHFPDTDAAYKNIDSSILLRQTMKLINAEGYRIGNIDVTVCAEEPKLKPHIPSIRARIADILELEINNISVKATTTEKMGFVGREEGIMCFAVVILEKK